MKSFRFRVSFGIAGVSVALSSAFAGAPFTFEATGSMNVKRYSHTATMLANGRVLVAGGVGGGNNGTLLSAETYDPSSGTWTETAGNLNVSRYGHAAVLLGNGKVLIVGGRNSSNLPIASAELFDPANGTWATTGSMVTPRFRHTATLLPNGKVLVVGGQNASFISVATAELYDPGTGTWSAAASQPAARDSHTATLLANGKVLVAGGELGAQILNTALLYDPVANSWTATGNLVTARYNHTATLLSTGQVLIAAGFNSEVTNSYGRINSAETYDPSTGAWTATGNLTTPRNNHTATLLPDGKVLVTGGDNGPSYLTSAELFDPASGNWSATGSMSTARGQHTAILLNNDNVLVAGGINSNGEQGTAELFNSPRLSVVTGSMSSPRASHTATLLPNGKVLVAGGQNLNSLTYLASAEIYDPATGIWTPTGSLAAARADHTAVLLPSGKVLVAGGHNAGNTYLASAELYDPITGTWSNTGSLNITRYYHTATLLANGKVLVAAGLSAGVALKSAELYDPASGSWTLTGAMATARYLHTATLLQDGRVLVAAGNHGSSLASAELYDPATGGWTSTGNLSTARDTHTTTLLPNGKVLAVGGHVSTGGSLASTVSSELYDPASGNWSAAGNLNISRYHHTATLLPDGQLLVTGGSSGGTSVKSAEVFDYGNGVWTRSGSLVGFRSFHTATLLASGRVLIVGGVGSGSGVELYALESSRAWRTTGSMATGRSGHTATLLRNGKVLVTGGRTGNNVRLNSTELFDPTTNTWTSAGNLSDARSGHTATLLRNGKVLIVGGIKSGGLSDPVAELYDSSTGNWSLTGSLAAARLDHTATLLPDGTVLVVGGIGANGMSIATAELYNPATGTWSSAGTMTQKRELHTATLLANGDVLVAGGDAGGALGPAVASAELFHPSTGTWTATQSMSQSRVAHSATLLPSGKVLVAGGFTDSELNATVTITAELYDPATGTWSNTGSMSTAHRYGKGLLLPDGNVVEVGGEYDPLELYEPATGTWSNAGRFNHARIRPTGTLLFDGSVLMTGGVYNDYLPSAERRDPLPFFTRPAWQPQVQSFSPSLTPGGKLLVTGLGFKGISQASGGTGHDSSTNYPVVQLRRLDNEQVRYFLVNPAQGWSDTNFNSVAVNDAASGPSLLTVFTNGIPSESKYLLVGKAAPLLTTQVSNAINLGGSINDSSALNGAASPTGTVTFNLYGPGNATCGGAPLFSSTVNVAGDGTASSAPYTPTETGLYRWVASYSGDGNNDGVTGACNEPNESVFVNPASPTPTPTPTPTPSSSTLANISTRLRVETGDNVLIGGFIVTGTQPKKVIIRAMGPSVPVTGALADPTLELYSGSTLLESNDNWVDSPNKQAIIDSTIPPSNDLESAIVQTLPANGAGYTAIVRGTNNGTGIGVVEAYDLDRSVDSKLANISTRGLVQTGDNVLIAGTIVLGQTTQKVIVRAIGPSLPIAGKLENPTLELRDQNGGLIEANDNWVDSPNKQAIIDSTVPPTNDLESAIVATLSSGGASYTAIVRGVNDTTGIAVVEIYALN